MLFDTIMFKIFNKPFFVSIFTRESSVFYHIINSSVFSGELYINKNQLNYFFSPLNAVVEFRAKEKSPKPWLLLVKFKFCECAV